MNPPSPYTKWIDATSFSAQASPHSSRSSSVSYQAGDIIASGNWEKRVGPPSSSADSAHFELSCNVPDVEIIDEKGEAYPILVACAATLTVDDWGSVSLGGNSFLLMDSTVEEPGPRGGHPEWTRDASIQLGAGNHTLVISGSNIDMPDPQYNKFVCVGEFSAKVLEKGGEECPCGSCSLDNDDDGGYNDHSTPPNTRSGSPQLAWSPSPYSHSSAATSVTASSDEYRMLWSSNFGAIRGKGSGLSGALQLFSEEMRAELATPAALRFEHVLASYLSIPESGFAQGARLEIIQGARVIALRYYNNGKIEPIGIHTSGGGLASLIEYAGQSCMQWQDGSGAKYIYSTTTGALLSYVNPLGGSVDDVDSYMLINRDAQGAISQIWSKWDGLVNIENISATGYSIAFYTNAQIESREESGSFILTQGAIPFKTFTFSYTEGSLTVHERSPQRPDKVSLWTRSAEGAWSTTVGTGDEAIVTTRTRQELEAGAGSTLDVWELITETSKGGVVATRTQEIYQSTPVGRLLLTSVAGYGSPEAQSTQYQYDGVGNLIQTTRPSGAIERSSYDATGRIISQQRPWGSGDHTEITTYSYAHNEAGDYNDELASREVHLNAPDGIRYFISREEYSYSIANNVKRVETRKSNEDREIIQLSVEETWMADAPNVYARNRAKMSQAINGVQTCYEYAATSLHGALYTVTTETRVENEPVVGQSTRSVSYVCAEGTVMREEQYILIAEGDWALTQGMTHQYDVQNRRIGTQYDNGRSTSRELICNGRTLWEIDENGIRTDYAYDSARTLIETTRAATATTPETITEWVKDANGQATQTRTHVGALITTESATYDTLGRMVSSTDALGRTTTTAYSTDGLTTTQTSPSGATFITRNFPSGEMAEQSGTGQRHLLYSYDLLQGERRSSTLLPDSNILSQDIQDCFGQSVTQVTPTTSEGIVITTHREYNEKGQLTREQVGNQAPMLYAYDSMGNMWKSTLLLRPDYEHNVKLNRIVKLNYSAEQGADGIYSVSTQTRYNIAGTALVSSQKTLISKLSETTESKVISVDERGNESSQTTLYGDELHTRVQNSLVPSSEQVATTTVVDGFTIEQSDHQGGNSTFTRQFLSTGILSTQTDPRGITTSTQTDIASRPIIQTDGEGNETTISYLPCCDQPQSITDALGNVIHYSYDIRNRKVAEYGTGIQPATFGYDDADRMTSLTTYRATDSTITTDPTGRTDGDTTTWAYHDATGLVLCKTYADGTQETRSYNALNQLATITNARGLTQTHSYNSKTAELTQVEYSDGSTSKQYSYNAHGQVTQIQDAAGTHSLSYNDYSELASDSRVIEGVTARCEESYDTLGRSSGYKLKRNSGTAQHISYSYDNLGRIATAGFNHKNTSWKQFSYSYLQGTSILATLTHPNGITSTRSYEPNRNLLTNIVDTKDGTTLSNKAYIYDAIARPTARQINERSDSFAYNAKSELTAAQLGSDNYSYSYDNIGNRQTAQEIAEEITYATNSTNEYTAINSFVPEFDADGNQTRLQTSTGIWTVEYNAENRPTKFTSMDGTIVEARYDYMGRRAWKKVTINGDITYHQAYIYRGYLQIASENLLEGKRWVMHFITWDPTQPTATRPLAIEQNGTWYTYGLDLSKNVTELYTAEGTIATSYSYSPFGAVEATGNTTSPLQWSSEIADEEFGLVYYNYRSYNPADGRWINRDPIAEEGGLNLYGFAGNRVWIWDSFGLSWTKLEVLKILCCQNYAYIIDDLNSRGLSVISFKKATTRWYYHATGQEQDEDMSNRLSGNSSKSIIRLNARLSNEEAASTLLHEILHTDPSIDNEVARSKAQSLYLEEEIRVRIRTEEFRIAKGMPATSKNYRMIVNGREVPNESAIRASIMSSQHYNPQGRVSVGR